MEQLVQLGLNGLALGCVYALVALGMILVYEASGVVNFATGQFVMVGTFVAATSYGATGLPTLAEMIGGLWLKAGPVLNLDLGANPERLAAGGAVRFHAEALAAIRAGDGRAARAAIAADIRGAADFIIARGGLAAP